MQTDTGLQGTSITQHSANRLDAQIQHLNDLENRTVMAKNVLTVLMMALETDDSPTDEVIKNTIWAAQELLTI